MMDKDYLTYEEAANYVGIARASIYNYIKDLHIMPQRFGRSHRKYIAVADVERMKTYRETPWKKEEGNHDTP